MFLWLPLVLLSKPRNNFLVIKNSFKRKYSNAPESMLCKYLQYLQHFGYNIFVLVYLLCDFFLLLFWFNRENKKREKGRIRSRKLNFPFVSRKLSLGIYLNEYIYSGRKIDFYRKRKSSYCFDQNGWCLLKTKSFHLFEIFKISTNLSEIYSIISAAK